MLVSNLKDLKVTYEKPVGFASTFHLSELYEMNGQCSPVPKQGDRWLQITEVLHDQPGWEHGNEGGRAMDSDWGSAAPAYKY